MYYNIQKYVLQLLFCRFTKIYTEKILKKFVFPIVKLKIVWYNYTDSGLNRTIK